MFKINDAHNIITLLLPTNEPETMRRFWLPSLDKIEEIAPISTIAINFQSPYTQKDVEEIVEEIESHGFKVIYTLKDKYNIPGPGRVPFNKIRNDTAMLNPNSLFYALTDDDFSYQGPSASANKTAGHQYLDIIHYMLTHERCGFTLIGGPMIRVVPVHGIGLTNPKTTFYAVKRGYILRNMTDHGFIVYPEDAIDLEGAGEEKIIAASRLALGYYPAALKCGRTHHYENWRKEGMQCGKDQYDWERMEVLDANVHKYLLDHYNVVVDGVVNMNICDPKIYLENGGLEFNDENRKAVLEDYTGSDVDILISKIKELAGV